MAVADDDHSLISYIDRQGRVEPAKYLGHPLQVWIGETGYTNYQPLQQGYYGGFTESAQAAYLARGLLVTITAGVHSWCIYDFVDDGADPQNPEHNFGLVYDNTRNYHKKPSYYAIQRIAKTLGPDWQLIPKSPALLDVHLDPLTHNGDAWQEAGDSWIRLNGPEIHWFKVGNDAIAFLWKAGRLVSDQNPALGTLTWTDVPTGAEKIDAMDLVTGNRLSLPITSTKLLKPGSNNGDASSALTVTVGEIPVAGDPIMIRFPAAEEFAEHDADDAVRIAREFGLRSPPPLVPPEEDPRWEPTCDDSSPQHTNLPSSLTLAPISSPPADNFPRVPYLAPHAKTDVPHAGQCAS